MAPLCWPGLGGAWTKPGKIVRISDASSFLNISQTPSRQGIEWLSVSVHNFRARPEPSGKLIARLATSEVV